MILMILFTTQKQTHSLRKELGVTGGRAVQGGVGQDLGTDTHISLYLKSNNELLDSTGDSAQLCNNLTGKRI